MTQHLPPSSLRRLSNLAVTDREGVAVLEITPERVVVRRGQDGTCVCSNHFCSDELKPMVTIKRVNAFGPALAQIGELRRFEGHTEAVSAVAFSRDGRLAATAGDQGHSARGRQQPPVSARACATCPHEAPSPCRKPTRGSGWGVITPSHTAAFAGAARAGT